MPQAPVHPDAASPEARSAASQPRPWEKIVPLVPIAPVIYWLGQIWFKVGCLCCMRLKFVGERNLPAGGFILACTHLSHIEPMCVGTLIRRRIHWMARKEFYKYKIAAWGLRMVDAFSVNRKGVPVMAIRTAIHRSREGRVVGMFPEGGVSVGPNSVCRGGAIKQGAALIACRAQVPIVPVVVLGTDRLKHVMAWMPWRRTPVWVMLGNPIAPRPLPTHRGAGPERRRQRTAVTAELQREFTRVYDELRRRCGIGDSEIP